MTLGEFLKLRRKQAGLTAKELLSRAGLAISTPLLSQWESGTRFPAPEHLERLSEALNIPLKSAFALWAKTQMPTEKLKQVFGGGADEDPSLSTVTGSEGDPKLFPASQTLVLAARDADWFNRHPAALTLLSRTIFASWQGSKNDPAALSRGMGITKGKARTLLEKLVDMKYLAKSGKGYKTPPGIRHLYPPHSDEFEPVRWERMRHLWEKVSKNLPPSQVKEGRGFRQVIGRPMTPEQIRHFSDRLEAMLMEIVELPIERPNPAAKNIWFVAALGPEILEA